MPKHAASEFCGISNGAPPTALPDAGRVLPALARNRSTPIWSLLAIGNFHARRSDRRRWTRESGRSELVRSFGRRAVYESLRGTNPRTQTLVYGYFCFRLSMAKSRPVMAGAGRDAICPNCRWM